MVQRGKFGFFQKLPITQVARIFVKRCRQSKRISLEMELGRVGVILISSVGRIGSRGRDLTPDFWFLENQGLGRGVGEGRGVGLGRGSSSRSNM